MGKMTNDNDSDEKVRPLDRAAKVEENCFIATVFGILLCILALAGYAALGLAVPFDVRVAAKIIGVFFLGGFAAVYVTRSRGRITYDPIVIHGIFAIIPGILVGLVAFVACLSLALEASTSVRVVAAAFLGGQLIVFLGCNIAGNLGDLWESIAAFFGRLGAWLFTGGDDKGGPK
jgi:hypothetical protein